MSESRERCRGGRFPAIVLRVATWPHGCCPTVDPGHFFGTGGFVECGCPLQPCYTFLRFEIGWLVEFKFLAGQESPDSMVREYRGCFADDLGLT